MTTINNAYNNTVVEQEEKKQRAILNRKMLDGINTQETPHTVSVTLTFNKYKNPIKHFAAHLLGLKTHSKEAKDLSRVTKNDLDRAVHAKATALNTITEETARSLTIKSDHSEKNVKPFSEQKIKMNEPKNNVKEDINTVNTHKTTRSIKTIQNSLPEPKPVFNDMSAQKIKHGEFMGVKSLDAPIEGSVPPEPSLAAKRVFEAGLQREENKYDSDYVAPVIGRDMDEYAPSLSMAA